MNSRREQIWVGSFVLVAMGILVAVVLAVSGVLSAKGSFFRTYFRYAAGLAPGAAVRYGGLLAGKVEKIGVDPQDSTRIEIGFRVERDIPVKTDSVAKITSLGALGDNYLEVTTGRKDSPQAAPGSILKSRETLAIADLGDLVAGLAPTAEQVLHNLNDRLSELRVTIAQVNDLLGDSNRKNLNATLATLNAMMTETRPKVLATLTNVQAASDRLPIVSKNVQDATERVAPLLDDLKGTIRQANDLLAHVGVIVSENRTDIRASTREARTALELAGRAAELLKRTLDRNEEKLDESLSNVHTATDNLKVLTETVKRRPSVLIRGETGRDRQPGEAR